MATNGTSATTESNGSCCGRQSSKNTMTSENTSNVGFLQSLVDNNHATEVLPPVSNVDSTAAPAFNDNIHTENNNNDNTTPEASDDVGVRQGTIASARFNILSTMVGGGCLSLPLAFSKAGLIGGTIMLVGVALISEFCFHLLISSARTMHPVSSATRRPGVDSYASLAEAALGSQAQVLSAALVTAMCFFGAVGYCVLLRDMLMPLTEFLFPHYTFGADDGPTWRSNAPMWVICISVMPLCTLQTLTALQRFGAASMSSILVLGTCIVIRSVQCNILLWVNHHQGHGHADYHHDHDHDTVPRILLWPENGWMDILNVFPLFVSCYVCHYNIPTVHNELSQPSQERVHVWLQSTTFSATAFYLCMGLAGAIYQTHCGTDPGNGHGNILLDFPTNDPLVLVGRSCLAVTLTLAFPMLTIPARDIVLSILPKHWTAPKPLNATNGNATTEDLSRPNNDLTEPLLSEQSPNVEEGLVNDGILVAGAGNNNEVSGELYSYTSRLVVAMLVFWSAAAVASCVASIDIVWDLLGSSLSILLSYLVPALSYLGIVAKKHVQQQGQRQQGETQNSRVVPADAQDEDGDSVPALAEEEDVAVNPQASIDAIPSHVFWGRLGSWLLLVVFIPLMFISTANAVYNTFFK